MTSPVFVQEHSAATSVVRPVFHVLQCVELAKARMKSPNIGVFGSVTKLSIAIVATNTNVEGIKVAFFIYVRRLHQTIGSVNVLEEAWGLDPSLLWDLGAELIAMQSVARLNLIHSSSRVWASQAGAWQYLVAFTWD